MIKNEHYLRTSFFLQKGIVHFWLYTRQGMYVLLNHVVNNDLVIVIFEILNIN